MNQREISIHTCISPTCWSRAPIHPAPILQERQMGWAKWQNTCQEEHKRERANKTKVIIANILYFKPSTLYWSSSCVLKDVAGSVFRLLKEKSHAHKLRRFFDSTRAAEKSPWQRCEIVSIIMDSCLYIFVSCINFTCRITAHACVYPFRSVSFGDWMTW